MRRCCGARIQDGRGHARRFHNVGWLCHGASRKGSRVRHTGRYKNRDEASANERKEIKRLPRLSLALELDEVVRSVGAAAGEAPRGPRLHNTPRVSNWRIYEIRKHLLVLFFCLFLVMIGFGITLPVFPFYAERLARAGGASRGWRRFT